MTGWTGHNDIFTLIYRLQKKNNANKHVIMYHNFITVVPNQNETIRMLKESANDSVDSPIKATVPLHTLPFSKFHVSFHFKLGWV